MLMSVLKAESGSSVLVGWALSKVCLCGLNVVLGFSSDLKYWPSSGYMYPELRFGDNPSVESAIPLDLASLSENALKCEMGIP